ncbi:hypothetical protein K435DRAFT_791779 [Dendrothele bispora CBS 962.96]|uniref:FAD/NAD(P)-binding domain-containing protein n=1 Tax=Dendrothele bispora (strain CBS 962.96) TaxID=1314807 RepID=A0A4S8MKW4_DENBC|nr:hypothetical protein K435DRAFT_791779 [Dendrothele bispora CBS 962.96]
MNHRSGTAAMLRQFCFDLDEVQEGIGLGFGLGDDSDSMHCEPLPANGSEMTCLDEVVNIRVVELSTASASRHSGSNASQSVCEEMCYTTTLIKGALGYTIRLSANFSDAGGGMTRFSCDLGTPNFNSNSDLDLDLHPQCVRLGHSIIAHTISSIPTMTTSTSFSTTGCNADFFKSSSSQHVAALNSSFSFPTFNLRPGDQDTTTGSTMSPLTNGKVDESSKMHSRVGFMGNGFAAVGQRTATVNGTSSFPSFEIHNPTSLLSFSHSIENFYGFPTRIFGPELMDEFCEQFLRSGTCNITETISKIDLSHRPGQEDEETETADTVIVATGASAKEVGIERCRGVIGKAGLVLVRFLMELFQFSAAIGGGDSAAEEATSPSFVPPLPCSPLLSLLRQRSKPLQHRPQYGSYIDVIVCHNELRASKIMAKRLMNNPKITILWNTTDGEKDRAVNGLFYAFGHKPATAIFPHPTPNRSRWVYRHCTWNDLNFFEAFSRMEMYRIRGIDRLLRVLGVDIWLHLKRRGWLWRRKGDDGGGRVCVGEGETEKGGKEKNVGLGERGQSYEFNSMIGHSLRCNMHTEVLDQ